MENKIYTIAGKKEEKFLRKKAADFDFESMNKTEISGLVSKMRKIMRAQKGIGLAANQIGLPYRIFVAEVPDKDGSLKFYAVFNPKIEKFGDESLYFEEGCLSVPATYGSVFRPEKIVLSGRDQRGKALKIKAWGLLARVFQHEVDHLEGKLFIDKAKGIHKLSEQP